jgi:signal transduction histidine kinase
MIIVSFCILILTMVGIVGLVVSNIDLLHKKDLLLDRIIEQKAMFDAITYEYFLFREDRALYQWQLQWGNIDRLYSEMEKLETANIEYLPKLRKLHNEQKEIFSVVANQSDIPTNQILSNRMKNLSILNTQKTSSILNSYFKINSLQKWDSIINGYLLLFIIIIPLTIAIITMILFLNKSIRNSLKVFTDGVNVIKNGDLGYRVSLFEKDELYELSENFNDMTANLLEAKSKRDNLEKHLIARTDQVEAANKELEAFSYSVSHDLRAPLRAIDGFSKVLLEHSADRLDGESRRYLNIIRSNTQNMGKLIDDLLSFSRIGKQEMKLSPIDMGSLAREVIDEIAPQNPDRTIQFKIQPPPRTSGDATLIKIVLMNLFANAVKFTRTKPESAIEFGGSVSDNEIVYYVKDHGVGFDMKYSEKLFGVFQRLHRQDEFEGTGVGLALVERIIHRHNGRVWAEGAVGEGAVFYFALPVTGITHEENVT